MSHFRIFDQFRSCLSIDEELGGKLHKNCCCSVDHKSFLILFVHHTAQADCYFRVCICDCSLPNYFLMLLFVFDQITPINVSLIPQTNIDAGRVRQFAGESASNSSAPLNKKRKTRELDFLLSLFCL